MDDSTTPLLLAFALAFCILLRSIYKAVSQNAPPRAPKGRQGDFPPSVFADLHRQIAEEPDKPGPWVRLAEALIAEARESSASEMKMHRLNEAVVSCRRALELSSSYSPAWRAWGQALFEMYRSNACREAGTFGEANAKFKEAAGLRPEDSALRLAWSAELERCAFFCAGEQQKRFKALADTLASQAEQLKHRTVGSHDPLPALPDMPGIVADSGEPVKEATKESLIAPRLQTDWEEPLETKHDSAPAESDTKE